MRRMYLIWAEVNEAEEKKAYFSHSSRKAAIFVVRTMATFQEIMTRGMIFYDEEYLEECKEFCRLRNIHYLPHIHSNNLCYHFDRENDCFIKQEILPQQKLTFEDYLYDTNLIDAFKEYEVLFVEQGKRLRGVVHFSDYNRSAVYEDIYKKLFLLEKGLVHLIIEYSGLRKKDLADFIEKKIDPNHADKPLTHKDFRGKDLSLKSLMEFILKFQLVKIRSSDIHQIVGVRNKIAHNDNLVTRSNTNPVQYSISSFGHLIHSVNSLDVALRQLGNRLYFMQETLRGDFSGHAKPIEDYLFK